MAPGQDGQSNPTSHWYPNNQYQNSYQHATPYFGTCYVCGIFGNLGKHGPNWFNNQQSAQSYLGGLLSSTIPPLLSLNTPPNISSHIFTPNIPPVLTQQLTADYAMTQHAQDETVTKLNKMAKENRLIKQAVCKTYNTAATGVLWKAKNKTANPNGRTNNNKQHNRHLKSVRFSSKDQDMKPTTTPAQKAKSTKPILKWNTKTTIYYQQSVTMISEDTDSLDDTETDHAYDHSSDQEVMMDILCPDLDSESDSNEDDCLFGTEWLDTATELLVSNMHTMNGKVATFIIQQRTCVSTFWHWSYVLMYIGLSLWPNI